MRPLIQFSSCLVAVLLLAGFAHAQQSKAAAPDPKKQMLGTWERTDLPAQYRQVKSFTDKHFTWVAFASADGKVVAAGGGTYTFDGKVCKEKYEYGSGNIQEFVKQPPPAFTISFKSEGYVQEGKAPNGAMLREVYRRAK